MGVTIIIASYGEHDWLDLGTQRAARSAFQQGYPVIYVHGLTLHDARNAGLAQVQTEYVVFLDADDELEPSYIDAMLTGSADLRAPAVRYIRNGTPHSPRVPRVAGHVHDCTADCMTAGNWCCVGTMARTDLLRQVGGWGDEPLYEDWALFARCVKAGAALEAIPAAVYRAHVRADSRNRAPDREAKDRAHWEIHRAVWPELHEAAA